MENKDCLPIEKLFKTKYAPRMAEQDWADVEVEKQDEEEIQKFCNWYKQFWVQHYELKKLSDGRLMLKQVV